jgi:hypothetical protein
MNKQKKLLYYDWNLQGDKRDPNDPNRSLSTPCGGFFYQWSILREFMKRGWDVYRVIDRDKPAIDKYAEDAFKAFSRDKRYEVYKNTKFIGLEGLADLPLVDLFIYEFRFKTKDNSLSRDDPNYSPDLEIQTRLLNHYQGKCPIVIFDLDYKFTEEDENRIKPWKVLETALKPKGNHTSVFIPFDKEDLSQFSTQIPYSNRMMVYPGNNYERDGDIRLKILPYAKKHSKTVWFYGNWLKDNLKSFRDENPEIVFNDRVGAADFRNILMNAQCVPLLAKDEYKERGYCTARMIETLFWGSIPLGFSDFYGINTWLPKELIVDMNNYERSMDETLDYISQRTFMGRINLRRNLITKIGEMHDASHFVDRVLEGGNYETHHQI